MDSNLQDSEPENFDYGPQQIKSYDESLSASRLKNIFNLKQAPVLLIAAFTFLNGLIGLFQPLFQKLSQHPRLFDFVVPFGLYHWSRALSTLFGFILIYLSFNLVQRKRMSFVLAIAGLSFSLLIHVLRARMEYFSDADFWSDSFSLGILPIVLNLVLLITYRKRFSVKSELRKIKTGLQFLAYSLLLALLYGTLGFFFLDKREFGVNFELSDSIIRTVREFVLIGNNDLHAHTKFASWFLDSLRFTGSLAAVFALYSLFRPIEYELRTRPLEKNLAEKLLDQYGNDALDYYKLLPDKSYIFSASGNCFVAYKTELAVAVALGDLTGPQNELSDFLKALLAWCHENGWQLAFMQTAEANLEIYKANSMSVLKVGEDAVVHLDKFAESGSKKKDFKNRVKKFEKDGYSFQLSSPPHASEFISELKEVSDQWLSLPGRRERSFSLGVFDAESLKHENIYSVKAPDGKLIAFVNQVRSYTEGQASIDLMRHRHEVPNGTMDYLFVKLLLNLHEQGFKTFNLGLAALSGVGESPDSNLYEKAVHQIYEHMNRFFSYKGLRNYKNKFQPEWQSRYLIYEGAAPGLLKTALAILQAAEP